MKQQLLLLFWLFSHFAYGQSPIIIDETNHAESIAESIFIDSVWAGHPVRFCLMTKGNRQYIAYYNATRNMVVGQRSLNDKHFSLYVLPPTSRGTHGGTSTITGWDTHNYLTLAIDRDGYLHMSGNMHVHPLTYFRSRVPYDITTLEQVMEMVGSEEKRCTYPNFMTTREGKLLFHYRDGSSGNGNEIYNVYDEKSKKWSRLLDHPLTDGQGLMNAYQSQPTLLADNWYHVYWVWRDTPDCSTNHDLSYMKSPDLINWYNVHGDKIKSPATIDDRTIIVDPIPPKGGIINLAAKLCMDENNRPVFVYHKYDEKGFIQFYIARFQVDTWKYHLITDWDYRWEFSGGGSINSEIIIKSFDRREDGNYEVSYWHIRYGDGTILLDKNFKNIGKVLKAKPLSSTLQAENTFSELQIQTSEDIGDSPDANSRFILKWETLPRNRDKPRPEPWPGPSKLYLYQLKK